jgi:hypothetical protein
MLTGWSQNTRREKWKELVFKRYIEFIGNSGAAKLFECSEATVKSWRYDRRQPSIKQAKKIIKAADGKLDFESIYGPLETTFEE